MKKVYLSILGIAALSCSYAQTNIERIGFSSKQDVFTKEKLTDYSPAKKTSKNLEKAVNDTLWSEDFASGIGSWTTGGAEGTIWMYDTDGPDGTYSDPNGADIITSTTADNGFLMYDADVYGGNNNYPVINGYITSPAIDLSSTNALTLNFQTAYRYCCSSLPKLKLQISTDDFTTNSEYIVENDAVGVNDFSGTLTIKINLVDFLSTATNKTNSKIRFVWDGFDSYYWQIDDIAITESNNNDIELSSLILNRVFGDDNTVYTNLKEYTSIPLILADTLSVQAIVKNNGAGGVQPNTTINLKIYDDQNNLVAQETGGTVSGSVNKLIYVGDTISFDTEIDLAQFAPGTYKILADLSTNDDNTDNDTISRTLIIDEKYLGQENYDIDMIEVASAGYNTTDPQDYFMVGNEYFFPAINDMAEVNIDGLEIVLGQTSTRTITPNTQIEVKVYEVQTGSVYVEVDQTRLFTITSDMIPASGNTNAVTLNFHQAEDLTGSISLETNKKYVIGFYHSGGSEKIAYAQQNMDSDFSSRLFTRSSQTSTDTWFWNGKQLLSRLVFDQTLGLEENTSSISIGNIYPNPTSGVSTVSYSLQNSSEVSVNIVDITGKKVYASKEGQKVSGKHTLDIDATEFNNGVYYVTISTDEEIVTKKLIKK